MKKILKKIISVLALGGFILVGTVSASTYNNGNVDTNPATITKENFWRLNADVEDDSMREAWFAFSKSDKNLSCSSASQKEKMDGGSKKEDGKFYANVSFLEENTTFYFKSCALDKNKKSVEGRILSFKTGNGGEENSVLNVETFEKVENTANSVKIKGRVSGADNVKVWFAFSSNDSSPRCESSAQTKNVYGSFDDKDYFYKRVNMLESSERYEFRSCAKNFSGDIFSGRVKSFSTDRTNYTLEARSETKDATRVGYSAALLNGKVFVNGTEDAKIYFMYGKDKDNLSLKTSILEVGGDMYFQASVKAKSNTNYYFQTVVEDKNNDILFKGDIKSFKTNKYYGTSSSKNTDNVRVIIKEDTIVRYINTTPFKDLIYKKTVSTQENKNYGLRVEASAGDDLYYKIRFVNNSNKTIKNFKFSNIIPDGLKIVELNKNLSYNKDTRVASWEISTLDSQESVVFVLKMKVLEGADKRTIVSSTKIESNKKVSKTNSVRIVIEEKESGTTIVDNGQSASIFGSNGQFPSTVLGWLVIVTLILLVVFIISKILEMGFRSKDEISQLEAMEEDKMN